MNALLSVRIMLCIGGVLGYVKSWVRFWHDALYCDDDTMFYALD